MVERSVKSFAVATRFDLTKNCLLRFFSGQSLLDRHLVCYGEELAFTLLLEAPNFLHFMLSKCQGLTMPLPAPAPKTRIIS